ncbi:MAG TPA: PEP/pyruvate-binding domain-containing protein, partial [Acidothermaceae bacterium]|nr:PEP/pyruvate-binding domain-containing protein [Acidothermaceae bacterium]
MGDAASLEPLVITLADPRATEPAVSGGKAACLAALVREGFAVPEGIVVTAPACAQFAGGQVSLELRAEIAEAVSALGGGPFAVRSSAFDEDSSTASFAGQYLSVLNVSTDTADVDPVVEAIRDVVASVSAEGVRAYRSRLGENAEPSIAVLVQRQVAADAAGVAFTADPVTGDRGATFVSAVRGLGDRLVNGEVTPQQWVVREGATECVAPGEGPALTAAQAMAVAGLAERVAAQVGAPQDVEWAIAGGVVHLLQARPITALPIPPTVDLPTGTWIKETGRRTDLITPFGASVALPLVSAGLASAFAEAGSLVERIDMRSIGGEVYLRIAPVGGHAGPPPPSWVLGILARVVPSLRARCRAARHAVDAQTVETLVSRWYAQWRPQILESTEKLAAVDITALSDAELAAHLSASIELLGDGLTMHFQLVPPYALALYRLVSTCEEMLGWGLADTLELLAGASGTTSEPTRALAEVAALVSDSVAVKAV